MNVITDGGIGAALGTGALAGAQNPATGKVSTNSYMWNVFYNFSPEEKTRPFIGVGMGISSLKLQGIGGAGLLFVPGEIESFRNRPVVVHCHHGPRSRRAAKLLLARGFAQVEELTGGIEAWSVTVDPGVPRY